MAYEIRVELPPSQEITGVESDPDEDWYGPRITLDGLSKWIHQSRARSIVESQLSELGLRFDEPNAAGV